MADSTSTPFTLHIEARKSRLVAGEGIVLDVTHEVRQDVEMETVELNRDRTRIHVTGLEDGGTRTFTGRDHQQLHHKEDREPVGGSFQAACGDRWSSPLELPNFTRPLPPGRYRIEIEYLHGADLDQAIRSDAVEVEVAPVEVAGTAFRWFGAAGPRGELGAIWGYRGEDGPHWVYQTATCQDPGAVLSAVDLGPIVSTDDGVAVLAHLNDIAFFHFERYAAWVDGARLGWLQVQPHGPIGGPSFTPHGLDGESPARIVDPPLHCLDGGVCTVVAGADPTGSPAFSLVRVDGQGRARTRSYPQAMVSTHACIGWHTWVETPGGELWWHGASEESGTARIQRIDLTSGVAGQGVDLPGTLLHLAVDQWLGHGQVVAVTQDSDAVRLFHWPLSESAPAPVEGVAYALAPEVDPAAVFLDCDPIAGVGDYALLLAVGDQLVVQMRAATLTLSPTAPDEALPRPVRVIATPDGELFVIVDAGGVGLQALSLGRHPAGERPH